MKYSRGINQIDLNNSSKNWYLPLVFHGNIRKTNVQRRGRKEGRKEGKTMV